MTFVCELSGESADPSKGGEDLVVTPSGHVCLKRLLLVKLSENGGVDPFSSTSRPLAEEDLVVLASNSNANGSASSVMPPRPPNASSLPNLLGLLQKEYDNIVLELFDTRKALEETRRELSQALYQNDAAVRVIARLAMERDAAQQQLQQWNAGVNVNGNGSAAVNAAANAAPSKDDQDNEPQAKRRRQNNDNETNEGEEEGTKQPLKNSIPPSHLSVMIDTWKTLSKERKVKTKAVKPFTADELSKNLNEIQDAAQSLHKPRSKAGISVMTTTTTSASGKIVTAGKHDKQIVCYNHSTSTVDYTISKLPSSVTCLDMNDSYLISGSADGKIRLYAAQDGSFQTELDVYTSLTNGTNDGKPSSKKIVHVTIHPSKQHILVTLEYGCVVLCGLSLSSPSEEDGNPTMSILSYFEPKQQEGTVTTYTCGALHPDGLIYGTGTASGVVHIWDLKNQNLAGTLANPTTEESTSEDDSVVSLAFSNNGYHIGTALGTSSKVQVWDLRKLKVVTTLNVKQDNDDDTLKAVHIVAFDSSGKHFAYGGDGGIRITTVKVWGITASLAHEHHVTGILWNNNSRSSSGDENQQEQQYALVTCSEKERPIRFYGC